MEYENRFVLVPHVLWEQLVKLYCPVLFAAFLRELCGQKLLTAEAAEAAKVREGRGEDDSKTSDPRSS